VSEAPDPALRLRTLLRDLAEQIDVVVPDPGVVRGPTSARRTPGARRGLAAVAVAAAMLTVASVVVATRVRGDDGQDRAPLVAAGSLTGLLYVPDVVPDDVALARVDEVVGTETSQLSWPLGPNERMRVFRRPGEPVGSPAVVLVWRPPVADAGLPPAPAAPEGSGFDVAIPGGVVQVQTRGVDGADLATLADAVVPTTDGYGATLTALPEGMVEVARYSGAGHPSTSNAMTNLVYAPPGAAITFGMDEAAGMRQLQVSATHGGAAWVELRAISPEFSTAEPMTVQGREAVLLVGTFGPLPRLYLTWAVDDTQFIVQGYGLTRDEVVATAASLHAVDDAEWSRLDDLHREPCEANAPTVPAESDDPLPALVPRTLPDGLQLDSAASLPPAAERAPRWMQQTVYERDAPRAAAVVTAIDPAAQPCDQRDAVDLDPTTGVEVDGQPARRSISEATTSVAWTTTEGIVVEIRSIGLSADELTAFAESLDADPDDPLTLTLDDDALGFEALAPPSDNTAISGAERTITYRDGSRTLEVHVTTEGLAQRGDLLVEDPEASLVDIAGSTAILAGPTDEGRHQLVWQHGTGVLVRIDSDGLTTDEVLAVARGITEVDASVWESEAADAATER
jgi:hypothetical protein